MSGQSSHVAIIGGGMGGLCLAQGLRKAGISVMVYERDESGEARPQGYRIHIDPEGSMALHACLPERLWNIFDSTVGDYSQGFTIMTEQAKELLSVVDETVADPVRRHRSVSRITLRRVLLAGMEDVVQFGKKFVRYEEDSDSKITVHFEDGSSGQADVVVGADGVHSRVRAQYMPNAEPVDTGVVGVGGTVPLTDEILALAPRQLLSGPVMVVPPGPYCLFMVMWKRSSHASARLRELGSEDSIAGDDDYLLWALCGKPRDLGIPDNVSGFGISEVIPGKALKDTALHVMRDWQSSLRELVELAPDNEIFVNRLRTSRPQAMWTPRRITLLGDAIHSMTPFRGIGGNIALKDADLLCAKFIEESRGEKTLLDAIGEYEAEMRTYAFAAVEDSLRAMDEFTGPKAQPGFAIKKAGMKTANALLKVKKRISRS